MTARQKLRTTNSNHSHPIAQNLLERNFTFDCPDQAWVGDITYISYRGAGVPSEGTPAPFCLRRSFHQNAFACFRQVNRSDVLILLELGDYRAIVQNTIHQIFQDFSRRSAIFSVNCLFRYKQFSEQGY